LTTLSVGGIGVGVGAWLILHNDPKIFAHLPLNEVQLRHDALGRNSIAYMKELFQDLFDDVLLCFLLFLRKYGLAQLLWRLEVGHALIGDLDRLLKNNVQVAEYDGLEAFDNVMSGTDGKAERGENTRGFWVLAPNHDGHKVNSAV